MDYNNTVQDLLSRLRRRDRALRTIASFSMFNDLSLAIGVSLALSSFQSRLILVLAAASSSWGFKMVVVLLLEVFAGSTAALPAVVFLSIVVIAVYNFWVFRDFGLYAFFRGSVLFSRVPFFSS